MRVGEEDSLQGSFTRYCIVSYSIFYLSHITYLKRCMNLYVCYNCVKQVATGVSVLGSGDYLSAEGLKREVAGMSGRRPYVVQRSQTGRVCTGSH